MQRAERLAAERTALPFVPFRNDIPDEAALGVGLNLLQALLTTVLAFRPARTLIEVQHGLVEEGSQSGFAGGDVDGFGLMGFRAGDQTLATEGEERAHSRDGAKNEETNRQHEN